MMLQSLQSLTRNQLLDTLKRFSTVALFLGNGPRRGYLSVPGTIESLAPHLDAIVDKGPTLAVFGGDTAVDDKPDLGLVMRRVRERWGTRGLQLLAVQGWDEVDTHVDYVYQHEAEACGAYGGFDATTGQALGATAIYLSATFWQACPDGLKVVGVGSGGRVGAAELAHAIHLGLEVLTIPAFDSSGEE